MTDSEERDAGQVEDGEARAEDVESVGGAGGEHDSGSTQRTSSRLWTPYGDPRNPGQEAQEAPAGDVQAGERPSGEDISEEELRRRLEEALEHITVADVVIDFMISMSSLAYRKMGIPHDVNEKHKDMEQARLAIDCIDALMKVAEERLPAEARGPLTGTLDNLKLNFVKES